MKRILVVLEAGSRSPSGVVRALVYRELFAAHGFSAEFLVRQPIHLMDHLNNLPSGLRLIVSRPWLRGRLLRWGTTASERRILKLAGEVDVVYLAKVLSYPFIRAVCSKTKARVVYDFGDAMWLANDNQDEFNNILKIVDAVTTDNDVTADYIRRFNANCTVIPDAPVLEAFDKRRTELGNKQNDCITLGWMGSPGTAYNLYLIWDALEDLFARHSNLHLRLVGTGNNLQLLPPFEKVRFSCRPFYNQAEMVEEVFSMDVGLFPLQNVERSRTRGVFKATNYMCGEAVVVASPVGQSADFIEDGVNGMLAGSTQEWIDKIELLINDAALRRRLAQNGLETVRASFRVDQSFAKLKQVLLANNGQPTGDARTLI
jgi:glycosyltransferase involved in cell wall biosynthesis